MTKNEIELIELGQNLLRAGWKLSASLDVNGYWFFIGFKDSQIKRFYSVEDLEDEIRAEGPVDQQVS